MAITIRFNASAVVCLMAAILASNMVLFVAAFPSRRDSIPNGYNVPDPCRPGRIWNGVGHQNRAGGGALNPFGEAFKANGFMWDSTLCNADSDNDGISNGVELGDPSCTWTPGATPSKTTGLSHPGIDNNNRGCILPPWLWRLLFGWTG